MHGETVKKKKRFIVSPKCPDWSWDPPSQVFSGYLGYFAGVKQSEHEVNHSPPFSAEVKNEWNYTTATLICLLRVNMESFTSLAKFLLSR
jgi:hypothetical protein